jgi:pyrroline-5-carboxylate reductase
MGSLAVMNVGFIGLGLMGKPMADHLARKLPPDASLSVFDVAPTTVDELCAKYSERVRRCESARDMAYGSVRFFFFFLPSFLPFLYEFLSYDVGLCGP